MENYSQRNLTKQRDKLAALAGFTSAFARLTGNEPVVGLWRSDLHTGLLWQPEETEGLTRTCTSCPRIIPSWSWASVDNRIG